MFLFEALNDTSISLDNTHRPKQDIHYFKYNKLLYKCGLCQSVNVKCQLRHGHTFQSVTYEHCLNL